MFEVGQHVSWIYTPRGGYGFSYPVNAEILKINPKTIRIRVARANGKLVVRNVKPEKLRFKKP